MSNPSAGLDDLWVQSALICEQVILPADQIPTLVRVIDSILVQPVPNPDAPSPTVPPDRMPPVEFPLTLVLVLRSAKPRSGQITIVANTPDGGHYTVTSTPARFNGSPATYRVNIRATFIFTLPGQYWFDVMFEERVV